MDGPVLGVREHRLAAKPSRRTRTAPFDRHGSLLLLGQPSRQAPHVPAIHSGTRNPHGEFVVRNVGRQQDFIPSHLPLLPSNSAPEHVDEMLRTWISCSLQGGLSGRCIFHAPGPQRFASLRSWLAMHDRGAPATLG